MPRSAHNSPEEVRPVSFYGDHVLPRIMNVVMDGQEDRKIRARVCAGLTGEVVEIGFGTGHNLL
jgi:hypothetical protein